MPITDFESLLSPYPAERFLSEARGRQWLHIGLPVSGIGFAIQVTGPHPDVAVALHQNGFSVGSPSR